MSWTKFRMMQSYYNTNFLLSSSCHDWDAVNLAFLYLIELLKIVSNAKYFALEELLQIEEMKIRENKNAKSKK